MEGVGTSHSQAHRPWLLEIEPQHCALRARKLLQL